MILTVIMFAATASLAQAGRKIPKTRSTPPVPTLTPEAAPAKKPPPKPEFTVKVMSYISQNAQFAYPKPENMHLWAIERMQKSPLLDVQDAGIANRRDAIKQAERETEAFVVFLLLEDDDFGKPDAASRPAAGQMWIRLSVFSPGTGKEKYSRKITLNEELNTGKVPPSVIRTCHTGIFGNDYLLLEASIKAAEAAMSSFSVPITPDCP